MALVHHSFSTWHCFLPAAFATPTTPVAPPLGWLQAFDELLTQAGVHRLCLPAAHETVVTWRQGFSFVDMPEDEVK